MSRSIPLKPGTVANTMLAILDADHTRTINELATATGYSKRQISDAAGILLQRRYIEIPLPGHYRLVAGVEGVTAITSGPLGPTGERERDQNCLRARAWRAMRFRRQFTLADIVADAEAGERNPHDTIRRYVNALKTAGYIIELPARFPGTAPTSNGFKVYRLLRNSGRLAPVYRTRRASFYDPNTRKAVPCR